MFQHAMNIIRPFMDKCAVEVYFLVSAGDLPSRYVFTPFAS
jgi:hypothetical protein